MKIHYITGNKGKFEEATHILEGWELDRVDIDLEEIQGTRHEIIKEKAKTALAIVNQPLIVEDVSMHIDCIGGLPGPYIKDFLRKIGDEGIADLVSRYDNASAQVICIAAYIAPGIEPQIFEGVLEGEIVPPKGDNRHSKLSWNPIFKPLGMDKTMGELSMEEHAKVSMRKIALLKLKEHLEEEAGFRG